MKDDLEEEFSAWLKSVDGIAAYVGARHLDELTPSLRRAYEAGYQRAVGDERARFIAAYPDMLHWTQQRASELRDEVEALEADLRATRGHNG
jgi:hypothetical protein